MVPTARSYIIHASKSYILFKIARSCLNKHVETQFEKMDVCFGFLIDTQKTAINVYIVPLFGLAGNMQSYLYVSIYSYYRVLFLNIYPVIRNQILAFWIISIHTSVGVNNINSNYGVSIWLDRCILMFNAIEYQCNQSALQ